MINVPLFIFDDNSVTDRYYNKVLRVYTLHPLI